MKLENENSKNRKIYILLPSDNPVNVTVWSNLSKLHTHLDGIAEIPSYSTVRRKVKEDGIMKFFKGDVAYRIIMSDMN